MGKKVRERTYSVELPWLSATERMTRSRSPFDVTYAAFRGDNLFILVEPDVPPESLHADYVDAPWKWRAWFDGSAVPPPAVFGAKGGLNVQGLVPWIRHAGTKEKLGSGFTFMDEAQESAESFLFKERPDLLPWQIQLASLSNSKENPFGWWPFGPSFPAFRVVVPGKEYFVSSAASWQEVKAKLGAQASKLRLAGHMLGTPVFRAVDYGDSLSGWLARQVKGNPKKSAEKLRYDLAAAKFSALQDAVWELQDAGKWVPSELTEQATAAYLEKDKAWRVLETMQRAQRRVRDERAKSRKAKGNSAEQERWRKFSSSLPSREGTQHLYCPKCQKITRSYPVQVTKLTEYAFKRWDDGSLNAVDTRVCDEHLAKPNPAAVKIAAKAGARFIPGVGEVLMVVDGAPVAWEGVKRTGSVYAGGAKKAAGHVKAGRYGRAMAEGGKTGLQGYWEFTKGAARTGVAAVVGREVAEATYYEKNPKGPSQEELRILKAAAPHLIEGMKEQTQMGLASTQEVWGHAKKGKYGAAAKRALRGSYESFKGQIQTTGKAAHAVYQASQSPRTTPMRQNKARHNRAYLAPITFSQFVEGRERSPAPGMTTAQLQDLVRTHHPLAWMADYELTFRARPNCGLPGMPYGVPRFNPKEPAWLKPRRAKFKFTKEESQILDERREIGRSFGASMGADQAVGPILRAKGLKFDAGLVEISITADGPLFDYVRWLQAKSPHGWSPEQRALYLSWANDELVRRARRPQTRIAMEKGILVLLSKNKTQLGPAAIRAAVETAVLAAEANQATGNPVEWSALEAEAAQERTRGRANPVDAATKAVIRSVTRAIYETVQETPEGAPESIIFVALESRGVPHHAVKQLVDAMVEAGLLTRKHNLLFVKA